ncbi:MAG: 50S ribosomal protein L27 [bacterium]|nr:50S ribosomal protein L27 [bacterium]
MAHTKAVGTTKLGRDSQPKYLGVKLSGGQAAKIGNIIIRQRGTRFVPGKGVRLGTDDTIYSIRDGHVQFITKRVKKYDGRNRLVKIVNVV